MMEFKRMPRGPSRRPVARARACVPQRKGMTYRFNNFAENGRQGNAKENNRLKRTDTNSGRGVPDVEIL